MNIPVEELLSESKSLLQAIKGKVIKSVFRDSVWPAEKIANTFGIDDELVFPYTAGALIIVFECGRTIGLASNQKKNSLVIWIEEGEYELEKDSHPIDCQDFKYSNEHWAAMIGKSIEKMALLKHRRTDHRYKRLPNEVGLCCQMTGNLDFIISHGISSSVPSHFALISKDQIDSDVAENLEYVEI